MTFEEFLGPSTSAASPVRPRLVSIVNRRLRRFRPRRLLVERAPYTLYEGVFHEDPLLDAFHRLGSSGPHLVLVVNADQNVGCIHSGLLYLKPEHHGKGLGIEMLIQLFLLNGPTEWRSRSRTLTPDGRASYERAYTELVRRGLIDPTPEVLT